MRILFRGSGFVNKGAEALVRTAQAELGRRLGEVSCFVTPQAIESGTHSLVAAAGLNLLDDRFTRRQQLTRTIGRVLAEPRRARQTLGTRGSWLKTACEIEHVDAIVDVSGYAYGDPWGSRYAADAHRSVSFAHATGKPYVFLPQAWGPFERAETRPRYRETCDRAALLFARDAVSRSYVADLLERPVEQVDLRPDIAFRFRGAPREEGAAILAGLGVCCNGPPLVGVAPNRQMYRRTPGTGLRNQYVVTLIRICQELCARNATVVVIPHEIEPNDNGTADDRLLCSMVEGRVADPRCVALLGRHDAAQIKSVIGHLSLLIGSRFHALVAALSCRVPVVALGWSHKYLELLRQFDMEGQAVAHDELSLADLQSVVSNAFEERDALRARLEERICDVERAVDATFDRVAHVLLGARS